MSQFFKSKRLIWGGLVFLLLAWAPTIAPAVYLWAFPPFVSGTIVVTVKDSVPVWVEERRDLTRDFVGKWETRVEHLTLQTTICPQLPMQGPRREAYHSTPKPSSSMSWQEFTGDYDGACTRRLARSPGTVQLEVFRQVRLFSLFGWEWWAKLPRAVSEPFEVGANE